MKKFLILLASISLIGCGSTAPTKPEPKIKLTNLPPESISFNISDNDPLGNQNITSPERIDLSKFILKLSSYSPYQQVGRGRIKDFAGVRVAKQSGSYVLSYVKTQVSSTQNSSNIMAFEFNTSVEGNKIVFNYPKDYSHRKDSFGFWKISNFSNPEKVVKDAETIFKNISGMKVEISKTLRVKGSVNTDYPEKSIYANFERILGKYRNRSSRDDMRNTFNLKVNGVDYPMLVEVFPYRQGSKVNYLIPLMYTVALDGRESVTADDIKSINQKVISIIND